MDWLCPNYSEVLARQLKANYGNITPETTIRNITAIVQTGDLHVVLIPTAWRLQAPSLSPFRTSPLASLKSAL